MIQSTGNKLNSYLQHFVLALNQLEKIRKLSLEDLKTLNKYELLYMLPSPSGNGSMICGQAAFDTLRRVSKLAWSNSNLKSRIREGDVFKEVKKIFVDWFVAKNIEVNNSSAGSLIEEAVLRASIGVLARKQF